MILDSQVERIEPQADLLRRHWESATRSFVEFPRAALERPIAERFEYIADRYPDHLALKSHDGTFSYAQFNRYANRLSRMINARLGNGNEPVALLFERGALAIVAMFGLLKAGKIYVALDPLYPSDLLNSFLADSQTRLIVTNRRNLRLAEELARQSGPSERPQIINVEEISPEIPDANLNLTISADTYAAIIYTSGSTGAPKGVIQSQRSILHFARLLINHYRVCPEDRQGEFFSYSFSGMMSSVYPMLLTGALLIPVELENLGLRNLADWIVQNQITMLHLTPQFHRQFFDSLPERDRTRLPRLRLLALGGGAITSQDVSGWLAHLPLDCVVSYSLASTETFAITRFFVDSNTPLPYDTLPVGFPEPDKQVMLVNNAGWSVKPGEVGEVVVKSRYLSPGYWRKPELTQSAIKPAPDGSDARLYFSGDLARERPDGMFELVGRKDFQVKIRGFTIQPGDVEIALYDLGIVKETIVVAAADKGEARLVAYVVTKSKPGPTVSELRARLKETLPESSIPSTFVFLDALPHTLNGKIDRMALSAPGSARPNLAEVYVAAKDALQVKLVQAWETVLGLDGIGILDDFFDLGGDSLKAEALALEVEGMTGKRFSAVSLLQVPTIEKLAAFLSQPDMGRSVIVAIQPAGSNPPLFLAHGLGGGLVHYAAMARLLGSDQPVYGIRAQKTDGAGSDDFEAIVANYVDELLEFYPAGPCLLGGYSYGAAVAYEMARQITQRGRVVAFLAIFDATVAAGYRRIRLSPRLVLGFFKNLPYWLIAFNRLDPGLKRATRERWTRRFRMVLRNRQDVLKVMTTSELQDFMLANPSIAQEQTEQIAREWQRVKTHTFQPYTGPLTLFRAQAQPILCSFDPEMNWKDLVKGKVSVETVPGLHSDVMNQRNIRVLAAKLKRCLEEVERQQY